MFHLLRAHQRAPMNAAAESASGWEDVRATEPMVERDAPSASNCEPTLRDRAGIEHALAAVLVDFDRLIDRASREDLSHPAQDGGWGMVEILPHMRDWESVNRTRIDRILHEDHPVLEDPDDSLWSIEHDYPSQDPIASFREFHTLREDLVARIRELDDAAWMRDAELADRGRISLHRLLDTMCNRDSIHLANARDVLV